MPEEKNLEQNASSGGDAHWPAAVATDMRRKKTRRACASMPFVVIVPTSSRSPNICLVCNECGARPASNLTTVQSVRLQGKQDVELATFEIEGVTSKIGSSTSRQRISEDLLEEPWGTD